MMKHDANSILREQGPAALRNIFDAARPLQVASASDEDYAAEPVEPRFVPVAIDDVTVAKEPAWLIDGLLPARGLACVIGPPKSGKSFLTTDMLCAVARGALYAGRETVQGPVVYLTGEGVNGFRRRLVAMRCHLGIEGQGVPFFMIDNVPDLGSEATDLPQLLAELSAFVDQTCPKGPRAIVLDTLARCMGEADENPRHGSLC
jgi:RecA-family ATPase